jgi:hypothetical protein
MKSIVLSSALIATACLMASPSANAVTVNRYSTGNASARCQGALPGFAGTIRMRPLAAANIGSSPVFVSCGWLSDQSNTSVDSMGLYARTSGGVDVSLSCTASVGYATGSVLYSTKAVTLLADGSQDSIYWYGSDFGGSIDPVEPLSVSCQLPAGAELNDMYFNYQEDVGA